MGNKFGIDISKHNGKVDFNALKKKVDFVMIREGYGKKDPNQIDKRFKENINGAKNAGIPVGVYHYSYARSVEDAINEAKFCLENINGYKLEYPVAFDIEDPTQTTLSKRVKTDMCKAFCETIENAGYYATIYTNVNWLKNHLYADELLSKYDLWLAQWNVKEPSYNCGLWQTSDKGLIDGISGNVDLNTAFKDYPAIMKSNGLNGFSKSGQTAPKTILYTVKKGDTLSEIAKKYNTTVFKLAKDNNIKNVNKIYANQQIVIKL